MNPVLDLPVDCLTAPRPEHLYKIEAMMAWPKDNATRAAYERALVLKTKAAIAPFLDRSALVELVLDLSSRPRLQDFDLTKGAENLYRCLIAGWILQEAVERIINKEANASMKAIIPDAKSVAASLLPKSSSLKDIEEKIWGDYRSVAHFAWAMRAVASERGHPSTFPCHLTDIPAFLANAELFRIKGETNKFFRRGDAILRPADSVRLPADLESAVYDLEAPIKPAIPAA
jgi:hypothetical protein